MLPLILSLAVGAALGAALGYFGQCSSGTCPLTATWWRGALFGSLFGLLFHFSSGRDIASARVLNDPDGPVQALAEDQFEAAVLQSDVPVIVDFYATWCGPCKRLAPTLVKLAGEFDGRLKFVKVDVDRAQALAARYEIRGVPTLLGFRAGKPALSLVGLLDEKALRARFEDFLGPGPDRGT
jgi:thioredoxin